MLSKYHVDVYKRERKLGVRATSTDVAKKHQDLNSADLRVLLEKIAIQDLDILRPAVDTRRTKRIFCKTGTYDLIENPMDQSYKPGDIEPVLIVYYRELEDLR